MAAKQAFSVTTSCPLCCTPTFQALLKSKGQCRFCFFLKQIQTSSHTETFAPVHISQTPDKFQLQARFREGCSSLRSNLSRIDTCCEDISTVIQAHITLAENYRDFMVTTLQAWKNDLSREIEEAIAETERAIETSVSGSLRTNYAVALAAGVFRDLTIFKYESGNKRKEELGIVFEGVYSSLQLPEAPSADSVLPSYPVPEHTKCLPSISSSSISYFDFTTLQNGPATELKRRIMLGNHPQWIALDATRVFVYTFYLSCATYIINSSGAVMNSIPTIYSSHSSGGLIVYHSAIHLFGGERFGRTSTESERMSLSLTHWSSLPYMHKGRSCFTPVIWKDCIYLCGGYGAWTIETFDGHAYTTLYISLWNSSPSYTLAVPQGDDLVVYSDKGIVRLSGKETVPVIRSYLGHMSLVNWCVAPVLVEQGFVRVTQNSVKIHQVTQRVPEDFA